MGRIIEKGKRNSVYATFVDNSGEEATLSSTPTISVYHVNNGVKTDVSSQDMTQVTGSTYYYELYFGPGSDESDYVARFVGEYSTGETVVGEEVFTLVKKNFFRDAAKGGGGIIKTVSKPTIWTKKEKNSLLESVLSLQRTLKEIKGLPHTIDTIPLKLKKDFDSLEKSLKDVEARNGKKDILDELIKLKQDLKNLQNKKEEIENYNRVEKKVEEVSNTLDELVPLILKQVDSESLEDIQNGRK